LLNIAPGLGDLENNGSGNIVNPEGDIVGTAIYIDDGRLGDFVLGSGGDDGSGSGGSGVPQKSAPQKTNCAEVAVCRSSAGERTKTRTIIEATAA
jgi:hypothetical protein